MATVRPRPPHAMPRSASSRNSFVATGRLKVPFLTGVLHFTPFYFCFSLSGDPHLSTLFFTLWVFFLVQFRLLSMVNPISLHCSSLCGCLCLLQFIHSNLVTLISPHCSSSPCRCLCLVQFIHLNLVKEPRPSVSLQPGIGWIGCVGYFIAFRSWGQCCIDVLLRLVYVGTKLWSTDWWCNFEDEPT